MVSAGLAPWPVEPKQRMGPFVLGMGVNEALAVVQKMGSLDRAELSFDENRPFDVDLSLRMPSLGLQLCFDGFQQDLRVIVVCLRGPGAGDGEKVPEEGPDSPPAMLPPLSYGGRVFAGLQQPVLCLRDAYAMFGPTYIGDFRSGGEAAYFLRYPGITFEFPLPEDLVDGLASRGEHPMELPGKPPPSAVRAWVFAEGSASFASPAPALPEPPEAVVVRPGTGVELRGRVLRFGSMPQDVFSDFGPPEQVCVKDVDAVRIHSARAVPSRAAGPDYYYNYFHLGLDVLFDGCTHLVKKVILHTNPPTHELFSRYTRCFFQLPIEAPGGWDPGLDGPPPGAGTAPAAEAPAAAEPAAAAPDAAAPAAVAAAAAAAATVPAAEAAAMAAAWEDVRLPPAAAGETGGRRGGRGGRGRQEEEPSLSPPLPAVGTSRDARAEAEAEDAQEPEATREDGADPGLGGEAAVDEDDGQPFQLAGRKMSKKERKAARKNRQKSTRTPVGSPPMPAESSPAGFTEPSPVLSLLDSEDRLSDAELLSRGSPPERRRGQGASPASAGRAEPVDDDGLGFDELLPPPALPLDGDGPDTGDAGGEAGEAAQGKASGPRGSSSGWGSDLDVLEIEAASRSPAVQAVDIGSTETFFIDVRWPWPKIQELLGGRAGVACGKPLLIVSQSGHTPYGSTSFYAFPGLAFEVMQNGWLASLTIFSVPREELPSAFLPQRAQQPAPVR